MPTYNIINKITGEESTMFCSISEMEKWEKKNKDWEVLCGAPIISSGVGMLKPTGHLKEKIQEIKRKTPGNHLSEYT